MPKSMVRLAVVLLSMVTAPSWAQTFQTIYTFPADGSKGKTPIATLTVGPDGGLYGTASEGGAGNAGTAFKIATDGVFTLLGSFDAAETGKTPVARMVNIGDGFLYGATSDGTGTAGQPLGTVFKLDPAGGVTSAGGLTKVFALPGSGTTPMRPHDIVSGESDVLHVLGNSPGGIWRVPLNGDPATAVFTFTNSDDGIFPERITRGQDGNLYGVTSGTSFVDTTPGRQGTIFKIAPNGTGFVKIHDCDFSTGVCPTSALVPAPGGGFYGAMKAGGANDGVLFKLTPNGSGGFDYTVLYEIDDNAPTGDLLLASDGRLYGTSKSQGSHLYGSVFRINTDGTGFQVLVNFDNTNGAYPEGGLVQAVDGNLYGMTSRGGANDTGTIFRIDLNLNPPIANRRPIAINDYAFSSGSAVGVDVLANDYDPDDDPLTVTIEQNPTHGTATIDVNGAITYAPIPGGGYAGFDEFQYRITDPDGLSATATVTVSDNAPPAPWQPTVYNGILNLDPNLQLDEDTPRGQLIINVSQTGVFTGKLFSQGKRYPVVGLFDEGGTAVAVVKMSKKNKAVLFLAQGQGDALLAILFGQEQWSGYLSPILQLNPPAPVKCTTVLQSNTLGLPAGYGYGTVRILSNNLVIGVGKMGDGTKLTWGTTLISISNSAGIPVYNEPVRGGVCAGRLFLPVGQDAFQGALKWRRPPATKSNQPYPNGFSGDVTTILAPFIPSAKGVSPVDFGADHSAGVGLLGPSIELGISAAFTEQNGRFSATDPLRSFSINRATGLFTGKMKVGGATVGFKGAMLQFLNTGYGYYTINKETGAATVGEN